MSDLALIAQQLSFRYQSGSRQILNEFSAVLRPGEIVGLSAPSGFGKTTLCRILAGYEAPDSGSVLLEGRDIGEYKGYCPVQMIWQHPELAVNPRLKMYRILNEAGAVKEEIIKGLGIEPQWLERYPGELSGGELQRFCIARALNEKTRFILADEISAMLDLITQAQIWQFLLKEAQSRNLGILVVSHSEDLLGRLCTRKIDMKLS